MTNEERNVYIEALALSAMEIAPKYGFKMISVMIAQACKESAFGTSELAVNANNHHGIKLKFKADGTPRTPIAIGGYSKDSHEIVNGQNIIQNSIFAAFDSYEGSIEGYYQFLTSSSAYAEVENCTDIDSYLDHIKSYATAELNSTGKTYTQSLKEDYIIPYNLTKYDTIYQSHNGGTAGRTVKVMLDAGHDGHRNQSPVYPAYNEATMAWKLQGYLKTELEKYGIEVGTTRSSQNETMDVVPRGKKAKGYDLFISLHSDATSTESVDRPSAIYLVPDASSNISEVSKVIGTRMANVVAEVMDTLQDAKSYYKLNDTDRNGDGLINDDYYGVLFGCHSVGVPGFILEHSFHTNLRSASWLYSDNNLRSLAIAEAATVANYFGLTKNSNPPEVVTQKTVEYTVQSGDSLSKIASKFNTTVDEIMALNKSLITNPNYIFVGWVLTVPDNRDEIEEPVSNGYIYNGVDYSLVFNPVFYANMYTDLYNAYGLSSEKLFNHFCKHGMKEGRQAIATFNPVVYAVYNADLFAAYGMEYEKYYWHFCRYGYKEGRVSSL